MCSISVFDIRARSAGVRPELREMQYPHNGAIVLAHEVGHAVYGLTDEEIIRSITNPMRAMDNVPLRTYYHNDRVPSPLVHGWSPYR